MTQQVPNQERTKAIEEKGENSPNMCYCSRPQNRKYKPSNPIFTIDIQELYVKNAQFKFEYDPMVNESKNVI